MDLKHEFEKAFPYTTSFNINEAVQIAQKFAEHYHALQLHKTQVSGSVCDKDDDFEPIIKHFRSEDTSPNCDDKPMGGFSDW